MAITSDPIFIDLGVVGPDSLEIMSEIISLVCITVLAVAIGSKTHGETLKSINYGRFMVIMLYLLSWAFATTSAVVVSTNDNNIVSCTLAMLSCDIFYAGSKIVIYAWLVERVHLVTAVKTARLKDNQYRIGVAMLLPYVIIFVLMLTKRNIYLEPDGKCTIGLQLIASVPLMVYDFLFNLYLTWLFMAPLLNVGLTSRANWKRSRLYKLARRTLVASIVSLLISFGNVIVVVITQGHERGLVCLTMCTLDVTLNAITVYWVTTNNARSNKNASSKNNTFHTSDQMSAERSFDSAIDKPKFNFDSIQVNDHDSKMDKEIEDSAGSSGESIRSIQASQLSAKPLHNGY